MKKYNVTVIRKEIYIEDVEVEANSKDEAIDKVSEMDTNGDFQWDDISDVEYDYRVSLKK